MGFQRFRDLPSNSQYRIQRGHRLLKDHGDLGPSYLPHLMFAQPEKILTLKIDFASNNPPLRLRDEAHDRQSRHSLAASAFPDQGCGLTFLDIERNSIHSPHGALCGMEVGPEIPDL